MNERPFTLEIPTAELERLVEMVTSTVLAHVTLPEPSSPWLTGAAQAAEYLRWPVGRVHKFVRRMPHYRVGGRLMFSRAELDRWVADFCEGPPRPSSDAVSAHPRRSTSVPRPPEAA